MTKLFFLVVFLCSSTVYVSAQEPSAAVELAKLNGETVSLYKAGKFGDALPQAKKAVDFAGKAFGKNSLEYARALGNVGYIQIAKGNDNAAEDALEEAWDVFRKQQNSDKKIIAEFAGMLDSLGNLKYRRGILLSKDTFETALELWEKSQEQETANFAPSLWGLANITYWEKQYEKSAGYFARLLPVLATAANKSAGDLTLAFYRAECSYRKAKKEEEFVPLKSAYGNVAEFESDPQAKLKAKVINAGVVNGKAISLPKPQFPADRPSVLSNQVVEVDVLISENGEVISACAQKSAHEAYIPVSEAAAYQSKFSPTTLEGRPVKVKGRISYKFMPH